MSVPGVESLADLSHKMNEKIPWAEWEGNCHAVATLAAELYPGLRVRRGHWVGPINAGTRFEGRPWTQHSWCVFSENRDWILDPTRLFFFQLGPMDNVPIYLTGTGESAARWYDLCGLRTGFAFMAKPTEDTAGPIIRLFLDDETKQELRGVLDKKREPRNNWGRWEISWALKHPELSWPGRLTLARALLKTKHRAIVPIDIAEIAEE